MKVTHNLPDEAQFTIANIKIMNKIKQSVEKVIVVT